MLATIIIVFGILLRVFIHLPNFTPIIALVLFGGVYLSRKKALILPLIMLLVTDLMLGLHVTMFFTWGSIAFIAMLGMWLKSRKTTVNVAATSMVSALIFFFVSNFGVWLASGIYPLTWAGLSECFILAIPFFRSTLVSTLVYSAVLFGAYDFVASRAKNTRFAHVL